MRFVSFFSGGGGFTRGFIELGHKCVFATDVEKFAEDTHNLNWPTQKFIRKDIQTFTNDEIIDLVGKQPIDVVLGGPPCQGFSNMGDKLAGDHRNSLVNHYLRAIKVISPKFVLIENVPGFKTKYNGRYFKELVSGLNGIGFNVSSSIINATDYGVPQIRKRILIAAFKQKDVFKFPSKEKITCGNLEPKENVGEALANLPLNDDGSLTNHSILNHSDVVIRRYRLIVEGGKLPPPEELPKDIRRKNFGNTYQRLHRERPATTMVPGNNAFPIHPYLDRSLTPREAARIQTFPDEHHFSGTRAQQCIQVGNAVPPLLASRFAIAIENYLTNKNKSSEGLMMPIIDTKDVNTKISINKKSMNVVDLFCGIGGFSIGFSQAGFNVIAASDHDKYVAESHKLNFPDIPFIKGDIRNDNIKKEIIDAIGNKKVDVLVGGPPCQGFSIFGKRRFVKNEEMPKEHDPRNDLVFSFFEMVEMISPEWVIMENVPGITSFDKGKYVKNLINKLKKIGYSSIENHIINCASFGVPQTRKRFILIAHKGKYVLPWPKDKYYESPKEWQKPFRNVSEVISDLVGSKTQIEYENHIPPSHNKIVAERYKYISQGEKLNPSLLPKHLKLGIKTGKPIKRFSKVHFRLDNNSPSPTLVPGHNAFPIHPTLNRTLTIREAARIQTIPDHIIFSGPIINQGLQAGNAFPPLVAQIIAERLSRIVRNGWDKEQITKLAKYSMLKTFEVA